ncbi:hypothetical protein [Rhizobium rhizosphaerae]|uniref:hypothetical protein n=1 Tax=Xaviernesmea rhizosphaerae TaxID=1672749 RepID=UPI0009C0E4FE|nr:hypothetical protein [Xaviernesmea rhizosphaerae]
MTADAIFRLATHFAGMHAPPREPDGGAGRYAAMKETGKKAGRGMMRFVTTIFAVAILLAAVYFFFFMPGDPGSATAL